jgi:hypothetical protein
MHDDAAAEMTRLFRDQLKQNLEQQRKMLERQREINAKLDVLIEALAKALALATCDDVQIEDVPPEAGRH